MKAIAHEYLKYLNSVFPNQEEIDIIQQIEMRRAFMAGAAVMFLLVNEASELPEEEAMKKLDEFSIEILEFASMVKNGVA